MCGRFILIPQDELQSIINQVERNIKAQRTANVSASYQDAFPKSHVPLLVPRDNRLEAAVMQWGYPVTWQKGPVFNTRADTATEPKKNIWSLSLHERRCVIPSFGFYEPHKSETTISPKTGREIKQQYFFRRPDTELLFMAGVYENGYFSIMTTEPNNWMKDIHPRMPVVLEQEELSQWLTGDYEALFDRSNIQLTVERTA